MQHFQRLRHMIFISPDPIYMLLKNSIYTFYLYEYPIMYGLDVRRLNDVQLKFFSLIQQQQKKITLQHSIFLFLMYLK